MLYALVLEVGVFKHLSLRDIPGIGFLFGKTITSDVRVELVMMLSPRIIRNPSENNDVIREYRAKFQNIEFGQD